MTTNYPSRFTFYPSRNYSQPSYTIYTAYPTRSYTGLNAENTTLSLTAADGTTYSQVAPARNQGTTIYTNTAGTFQKAPAATPVYATLYAPVVKHHAPTGAVGSYVGTSPASNVLSTDKGFINIKYDGNP